LLTGNFFIAVVAINVWGAILNANTLSPIV